MRLFNPITLQTPESVELEFTLAGIGNRTFALLIDYTALAITQTVFLLVWSFLVYQILEVVVRVSGDADTVELWLIAITAVIAFVIYVGYFVFFETVWRGQTPGKRYVGIRVIRGDGRPAGLAQATLRALLRPIDDILFLGVFFIVLDQHERRIGDFAAGTLVIQEARTTAATRLAIAPEAQPLASELQGIADLAQLTPDDFAIVREFLQRRSAMNNEAKSELGLALARQLKNIISLEKVPEGTTSEVFLEAVYLAYQQQPLDQAVSKE